MGLESKYTFGDKQMDGSIEILKDGKQTFCPKAVTGLIPNPAIPTQAIIFRPGCSRQCPFFQAASRKKEGDDIIEMGYVLNCMDRPIWITVEEKTDKSKMTLLK